MDLDLLEKFSIHLRNTLARAIDLAWELKQESIPPFFLLLGMYEQKESLGSKLLQEYKVTIKVLVSHLRPARSSGTMRTSVGNAPNIPLGQFSFLWPEFSGATKKVIELATRTAFEFQQKYVGTEHLLYALVTLADTDTQKILQQMKIPLEKLRQDLKQIIHVTSTAVHSSPPPSAIHAAASASHAATNNATSTPATALGSTIQAKLAATKQTKQTSERHHPTLSDTPALDFFGTDLTAPHQLEKIDPVIGRESEIQRVIHILLRRTKNNPVLIGEPGVGKTAIVEGLARRIAEAEVPEVLLHKKIVALDLSLVVAGTMYRGEFESRLKQIMEELKNHPEIILFIDEIHTLVGAGEAGQNGSLDAANILKPALAKGLVRCIGATTTDEYRKHIEADAALERRFQPVVVREPSPDEAEKILRGLRGYYEKFHHISITDDAVAAAVRLSARYMPEKRLPDKAIDLLDEAGAKAAVSRTVPEPIKKWQTCARTMQELQMQKEEAAQNERFNEAVELKNREAQLTKKMTVLSEQINRLNVPRTLIAANDVAKVAAAITGVPVDQMLGSHANAGLPRNLEKELSQHIIGQDHAINKVVNVLKRSLANLGHPHRPMGSFIFLGPSGVGKTELAKVLARLHFGSDDALIRVDMSELSESFQVSRLIGAPAGYVGYKEGVKFADKIRRNSYAVVLFDEIEKAHPDIFNTLLQILDEGRLTDAQGHELNFRNSVIIMTSNVGLDLLTNQAGLGFDAAREEAQDGQEQVSRSQKEVERTVLAQLREVLPLEFLNRVDHCVVFNSLTPTNVAKIVQNQFTYTSERLRERGIMAILGTNVSQFLARASYSPEAGARLVRKKLEELVEEPLAEKILAGHIKTGDFIKLKLQKNKIVPVKLAR